MPSVLVLYVLKIIIVSKSTSWWFRFREFSVLPVGWNSTSEEVNAKWKGCIVFPRRHRTSRMRSSRPELYCADDDGAPHWITVDTVSTCTAHLLLQPCPTYNVSLFNADSGLGFAFFFIMKWLLWVIRSELLITGINFKVFMYYGVIVLPKVGRTNSMSWYLFENIV